MDNKIKNILFFLIVISLIFNNIPKIAHMGFLGGYVGSKLVFYPLVLSGVYTIYCHIKNRDVLIELPKFRNYLLIYLFVVLLSLVVGLYNFPYLELITNDPINQIEKLPTVLKLIEKFNIDFDVKYITFAWMIARYAKIVVLEGIYLFGGAYMIFCWYKDDIEEGFKVCCFGILASILIIFCYSSIEVFYLAGNQWAKEVLTQITPYFLEIGQKKTAFGWPPVLWYSKQLRSVFAEPSYFSIYAAFCIPFLWYLIVKNSFKSKKMVILLLAVCLMTFFVFLTRSRTGVALILGELCLVLFLAIYLRNFEFIKKITAIICCSILSFVLCNVFISSFLLKKNVDTHNNINVSYNLQKNDVKVNSNNYLINSKTVLVKAKTDVEKVESSKKTTNNVFFRDVEKYLDSNLKSIASTNRRSNTPRFAYVKAAIKTGMNNPLLGVGRGFAPAYMIQYFTPQELRNKEVQLRIVRMKELGVLYAPIPIINEYAKRFADTGIIGICLFFYPLMYLLFNLINLLRNSFESVFLLVSLIGIMASGVSATFDIAYYYPVLLGLGYAVKYKTNNSLV